MAILDGALCAGPNAVDVPGVVVVANGLPTPGTSQPIDPAINNGLKQAPTHQARTVGKRLNGGVCDEYGERFWRNHWHIRESEYVLGNVISEQVRTVYVHNGFRTAKNVTAIGETGVEGVTLSSNGVPPFSVAGQNTLEYEVTVREVGPPNINYVATFDFENGASLSFNVTGTRIVVFIWDQQAGIIERWEWNTNVIQASNGEEQRISVRNIARQVWSISTLGGDELVNSRIENIMYGWPTKSIAFPVSLDELDLTSDIVVGTTVLPVSDTANTHYVVGDQLIITDGEFSFETLEVQAVAANTITCVQGTLNAWTTDAKVYPIHIVSASPVQSTLWKVNARQYNIELTNLEPTDFGDDTGVTTYQSIMVWPYPWYIDETYNRSLDYEAFRFDGSTGSVFDKTARGFPKVRSSLVGWFNDRAEYWNLKRILMSRQGKRKSFWLASGRKDFQIESDGTGTSINVEDSYYTDQVFSLTPAVRRHIKVVYTDGSFDYREITAAVRTPGLRETLTVAALTQSATIVNVDHVEYLYRVRLDADALEFNQQYAFSGKVTIPIVEVFE